MSEVSEYMNNIQYIGAHLDFKTNILKPSPRELK